MTKHDVTRTVLAVIEAMLGGNHLQIIDMPVVRTSSHFGENFLRVGHKTMVSLAVPPCNA